MNGYKSHARWASDVDAALMVEWGPDGLYRAALLHAIECYGGPADDTVPVLRSWLARIDRAAAEADQ